MNKKIVIPVLLAAIIVAAWFLFFNKKKAEVVDEKLQAITVSKHSDAFNKSISPVMTAYFALTTGFVNWDTVAVAKASAELKTTLDSLKITELQKDTVIYESALGPLDNIKTELAGLIGDETIEKKRQDFNMVSQNLYDFLRTIRYDNSKLYFQECPMAFDDEKPGNWLSTEAESNNPYLGTKHPKYGSSMLSCGEPKDTLNFMLADTLKK
ncbi:MAG: DUF3347 domain-containing protein [Sphingobacteriales bacterium]|nr:DUF3347 domain-containing protein [Sphingobacteriales bacterium]